MDTNSENTPVENLAETVPPLSVGKALREARISQGLSVADVASSIKFAPRQVEALEADDYTHLPELAFVRGFVRSYARLLHIDEMPLLNELPLAHQKLTLTHDNLADVPFSASQSTRRVNLTWLIASLGVLVVLGLGIWALGDKPAAKQEEPVLATIAPIEPAVSSVAAASSVAAPLPDAQVIAVTAKPTVVVPPKPVSAAVQPAPAVPVVSGMVKPPVAVPPKPVTAAVLSAPAVANKLTQGPIHLVFETESWVDIKDKFGKTIFKQVNAPNTEQWVDGRHPFSLIIGNSSGVRLYYEGEEIDLDEFTDVEVARLILE